MKNGWTVYVFYWNYLLIHGRINFLGVIDDRGKFIYITVEELQAVADFVKKRGRVTIQELVENSNNLITLNWSIFLDDLITVILFSYFHSILCGQVFAYSLFRTNKKIFTHFSRKFLKKNLHFYITSIFDGTVTFIRFYFIELITNSFPVWKSLYCDYLWRQTLQLRFCWVHRSNIISRQFEFTD